MNPFPCCKRSYEVYQIEMISDSSNGTLASLSWSSCGKKRGEDSFNPDYNRRTKQQQSNLLWSPVSLAESLSWNLQHQLLILAGRNVCPVLSFEYEQWVKCMHAGVVFSHGVRSEASRRQLTWRPVLCLWVVCSRCSSVHAMRSFLPVTGTEPVESRGLWCWCLVCLFS